MSIDPSQIEKDEDGYIVFRVPVDDATVAWLCSLAGVHGHEPRLIAAAILRDVREDDDRHQTLHPCEAMLN